jgi:hypothetical protein
LLEQKELCVEPKLGYFMIGALALGSILGVSFDAVIDHARLGVAIAGLSIGWFAASFMSQKKT